MSDPAHEHELIRKLTARTAETAPADPAPDVNPLSRLQRMIGNRAVQRLVTPSGKPIQTKMTVTSASDPTEAEADAVAEQVVRKVQRQDSDDIAAKRIQRAGEEDEMAMKRIQRESEGEEEEISEKRIQAMRIQRESEGEEEEIQEKRIQRESEGEEEEISEKRIQAMRIQRESEGEEEEIQEKRIQRESEGEEEEISEKRIQAMRIQRESEGEEEEIQEKRIQRAGGADMMGSFNVGGDFEDSLNAARGGGKGIEEGTRGKLEGAMGADFSGVKIHDGKESDALNSQIQAKAFTTGKDIFFKSGEYNPGSTDGQKLLAHELTHTIQQGAVNTKREDAR